MGRRKAVSEAFYRENFLELSRKEPNKRVYMRLLACHHIQQGRTYEEVSRLFCVHWRAVHNWMRRYKALGIDGLRNQGGQGRKARTTASQESIFKAAFLRAQKEREGGRLTGKDAQQLLASELGVNYQLSATYRLLHRVGLSWISGRDRHPNDQSAAQEAFKKTFASRF